MSCSNRSGSFQISGTKGKYWIQNNKFKGVGGKVDWKDRGWSSDSVYANLSTFSIDVKESQFKADSVNFYNKSLSPLRSFVLPGGSESSIFFHLARTVVRRAERKVSDLLKKEKINPHIISYLNRLSDLLFVLARYTNNKGKKDILWIPGKNTGKS